VPDSALFALVPVFVQMRFSVVSITLADVVQSFHGEDGCPYPAHLFIDVLAKIGYIDNASSIVQASIGQIFPEIFEHGQRNLPCVCVQSAPHSERMFRNHPTFQGALQSVQL
jgi:hypothetical protein